MVLHQDQFVLQFVYNGLQFLIVLSNFEVPLEQVVGVQCESSDLFVGHCFLCLFAAFNELYPILQVFEFGLLAYFGLSDYVCVLDAFQNLLKLVTVAFVEVGKERVESH